MLNHLKMTMENITKPSPNQYQFDLYIQSDGSSDSDLRLNSVVYGINFAANLFPAGAVKTLAYVDGSSELKMPPLTGFSFVFPVQSPTYCKVTQSPILDNTNDTMVVGQKYLVGTFTLSSSVDFNNVSPAWFLQSASGAGGKSPCAAVVWIGTNPVTTAISATGTGNNQRTLAVI